MRKLLSLKFGELPQSAQTRITHAAEVELDRWTERVLSAETLEAVIGLDGTLLVQR